MILEETKRLNVVNKIEFDFPGDVSIDIEGEKYEGDTGVVYDIDMPFKERSVRILLFDSKAGREKLLTGRFIHGKAARFIYRHCCATTAKALLRFFPDVIGHLDLIKEHQILRAGRALTLTPFIEGLKTQGDDFKRNPVEGNNLYHACATKDINWGPETARIFSDICPASGSTMEAFFNKALEETNLKRIIFNCSTSTINALNRVIPIIPPEIEVTVVYWEALFSVWRDDVILPNGEVIHGGTIINLNPDPDYPQNNPIAPKEVMEYIHDIFQRDRLKLLPDIPGEVGEKIQEAWVGPLTYDFIELYNAGIDFTRPPWKEKAQSAWNMPGVQTKIKTKLPHIYSDLKEMIEKNCHSSGENKNRAGEPMNSHYNKHICF
ncbi:MAG: hypothetical protein K8T10_17705 [Candidatus Eremiobacteraeota bacterium]|nr:hypothetical protein [Candidatus Eremiobacteraeota bacterium]